MRENTLILLNNVQNVQILKLFMAVWMHGEEFFFGRPKSEHCYQVKTDHCEEEINQKTVEAEVGTEEPECNIKVYKYKVVIVNQIKQLAVFTLQKGDIDAVLI